jgi:hypothetical protein
VRVTERCWNTRRGEEAIHHGTVVRHGSSFHPWALPSIMHEALGSWLHHFFTGSSCFIAQRDPPKVKRRSILYCDKVLHHRVQEDPNQQRGTTWETKMGPLFLIDMYARPLHHLDKECLHSVDSCIVGCFKKMADWKISLSLLACQERNDTLLHRGKDSSRKRWKIPSSLRRCSASSVLHCTTTKRESCHWLLNEELAW